MPAILRTPLIQISAPFAECFQGRSYYNAAEFQLAKRMSHGFQAQGTFTWGKSMDTSSATLAGDAFGNSISSLNWFDMSLHARTF